MVREILTISVGQGGVQLGNSIWKQYCNEHDVDAKGNRAESVEDEGFGSFFEETSMGQYVPRNVSIDLDPTVINDVKRGDLAGIYHEDFLISGKEDAANNFARGHYTVGKELLDRANDCIRKLVDNSENAQGFLVNHAVGGGTGSGLGMLILECLMVEYRKKSKIGFEIYPSPNISTAVVEPYNGVLSTHMLLDNTDVSIVLDNEALYDICQKKLDIETPSYKQINNIISKVASSTTASLRFCGELNVDLDEFLTNLVPFPRLHFMTTSLAPLSSRVKAATDRFDCKHITTECLDSKNFLVSYPNFDVVEDKYMAISLNYRGSIGSKDANQTLLWAKNNAKATFVEWSPCGWKLGLNSVPAACDEKDAMAKSDRNCVMIANNTAISRVFQDRLCSKFDMMYSQRAYVHWYVGEGMEEGEFLEAREDLDFLSKDYQDTLSELDASDEEDTESF